MWVWARTDRSADCMTDGRGQRRRAIDVGSVGGQGTSTQGRKSKRKRECERVRETKEKGGGRVIGRILGARRGGRRFGYRLTIEVYTAPSRLLGATHDCDYNRSRSSKVSKVLPAKSYRRAICICLEYVSTYGRYASVGGASCRLRASPSVDAMY